MNPKPGEVWLVDLGLAAKMRPVLIVSRADPNPPRALVVYVPLTSQNRGSPYEVVLPKLPFLNRDSVANVQGLGSVPTVRLERKLDSLPEEIMLQVKVAISNARSVHSCQSTQFPCPSALGCFDDQLLSVQQVLTCFNYRLLTYRASPIRSLIF